MEIGIKTKSKMKKGKKVMLVLGIIMGVIALLMIVGFILNKVAFSKELEGVVPKGQLVEANGGKINVSVEGNGKQTIVIIPGYGVSYPIGEYAPLQRALRDDYTVAICDYKGTGFSSKADTPRTNENIVEDIRVALKAAGIKGPYILMPHSIGGVYSQYYATKYPNEIAGIVMLDGTPTISMDAPAPTFILGLSKFIQNIGVTRLQVKGIKLPYTEANGYTKEEDELIRTFIKRMYNDTVIDQAKNMMGIIKEVENMKFPDNIPVYKIISKQTYETQIKQIEISPQEIQQKHLDQLGNMVTFEIFDGPHLMEQEHSKEVAELAKKYISENIVSKQ